MLRQSCWQLIAFLNCPVLVYCKCDLSTHSERMEMVFKNWNIWIAFREALDVSEKPRFDLQCELAAFHWRALVADISSLFLFFSTKR